MSTIELSKYLDKGIKNKLCVQGWLGYGLVLFIGFGDEVLSGERPRGRHRFPPYEIQTNFADWTIASEGKEIYSGEDNREIAETNLAQLLGKRVIDWQIPENAANMHLAFEDGLSLNIAGFTEPEDSNEHAWALRLPDGSHLAICCSGAIRFLAPGQ